MTRVLLKLNITDMFSFCYLFTCLVCLLFLCLYYFTLVDDFLLPCYLGMTPLTHLPATGQTGRVGSGGCLMPTGGGVGMEDGGVSVVKRMSVTPGRLKIG